jgi:hypothetical protein
LFLTFVLEAAARIKVLGRNGTVFGDLPSVHGIPLHEQLARFAKNHYQQPTKLPRAGKRQFWLSSIEEAGVPMSEEC